MVINNKMIGPKFHWFFTSASPCQG